MAKKIVGRADSVLVGMALKEGMSQIPADMSGVLKEMGTTYGLTNAFIQKQFESLVSQTNEANEELLSVVNPLYDMLQDGSFTDEDMMSFTKDIDALKEEWKTLKTDEERMRWTAKSNRIRNSLNSFNNDLNSITTMIANDQYVAAGSDGFEGNTSAENLQFLTAIYNKRTGKGDNKAERIIDSEGNVSYTATVKDADGNDKSIEMSLPDIKKIIPTTDNGALSARETLMYNIKNYGNKAGTSYNSNYQKDIADGMFRIVNSSKSPRDAFLTLAHQSYSGATGESFYEALNSPYSSLSQVLKNSLKNAKLPASKFDKNNDDKVNELDFQNFENFQKIKQYIMNNPKVGARLLGDWTAATDGLKSFSVGEGMRTKNGGSSGSGTFKDYLYYQIPGSDEKRSGSAVINLRNQIKNIVLGKTKNNSFTGYFTDYIYQTEGKNAGEFLHKEDNKYLSVYDVLIKEGLYDSKDKFDIGLGTASSENETKQLSAIDLQSAQSANEIFKIIDNTFTDKNEKIRKQTGSAGGLRVEKSGQEITLFEANKKIGTFSLGGNYGFGLTSRSADNKGRALDQLEKLINAVNSSLGFISDEYNSTQKQ
tara:strand:- start:344 stop:2128 length:1785 start_codon:yes stop_codon:yes gene_type:complete